MNSQAQAAELSLDTTHSLLDRDLDLGISMVDQISLGNPWAAIGAESNQTHLVVLPVCNFHPATKTDG